jgi:adenosylcobinamide kinase/adenosylcobinamide-phosphate guanylyltransferase
LLTCSEPTKESKYREKLKLEIEALIDSYQAHPGEWIIVSNEVGLGLVPPYPLGRFYRDGLEWANQELTRIAD